MKRKIIGSILVIILCMQVLIPTVLGAQNVVTDEITTKTTDNDEEIQFEDTNLKNLLIKNANVDKDSNGIITLGELETLTELTINTQINSLKGLENAKNLTTLKFDTDEAYIFSDNFFSSMSSIKNIEIKDIGNDNVKFLSNLTLESLTISNSKNVLDWSALKTASIKQLKLETIKLQDNSNLMEIVNSKELDNTEITCCIHYDVDLGEIKLNSSAVYELIDVAPVVYEYDNPDGRFKGNIDTHTKSSPSDFDDNLDIDGFNKTVTINTSRVGSTFSNVVLTPKAAPFNVEINFIWKIVADGDKSKEIVFEDESLKQYMIENYDVDNDKKITEYDMNQIGELNIYNARLNSLVGLEKLNNVRKVNISTIITTDLSPLANLKNIILLRIYGQNGFDLNGLGNYPNLVNLSLGMNNKGTGHSKIGQYTNLTTLDLGNCKGIDTSDLKTLNKLENLTLSYSNIKDIEFVKNMPELKVLNIYSNQITNVEPLATLTKLETVSMTSNPIDTTEEKNKAVIETLRQKGVNVYVDETKDITETIKDENLKAYLLKNFDTNKDGKMSSSEAVAVVSLDISNQEISSLEGLQSFISLIDLNAQNNNITNLVPLLYLQRIEIVNLANNKLDMNDAMTKKVIDTLIDTEVKVNYENQNIDQGESSGEQEQPQQPEDNTYVGNINSELKQFNVGIGVNNSTYVSGEIVVVEWVNGVSTVPKVAPKMRFKSTDGTIDMEVFVTATGTNTYYFDRYIEGIDTNKKYYFEIESGDSNNISENRKMNVYFSNTKFENTVVGKYKGQRIRLKGQEITFEKDTYVGNINSELKQFNVGIGVNNSTYVSGEIVVVEWVDGKSTVPEVAPKMRFKSTDGTVDMEVFVTATGTNTYYFDRYIEGIDTSKQYYFEIESGDSRNVSENRKMNVYFSNTKFENTVVGKYKGQRIRLKGQEITFEADTYVGNLNTELKNFSSGVGTGNASYVSGEIVVVEWVDGVSTVPEVAPKMRFKSTDGTVDMEVFVTATGTNTYYFDRYIEGIDISKAYYFEVESGDSRNVSEYRKVNVYFTGDFNNKIIGAYGITYMIVLENNSMKFKLLDKSFPLMMNTNEQETFDLVNAQRVANGIAPLQVDTRLQLLARRKAEDMVAKGYFDHQSPTYGSPFDMMNTAGIYYYTASENIAGEYGNSLAVMLWMNSTDGHREAILNSNFNYTGVGVVEGGPYGRMYVQIFMGA